MASERRQNTCKPFLVNASLLSAVFRARFPLEELEIGQDLGRELPSNTPATSSARTPRARVRTGSWRVREDREF